MNRIEILNGLEGTVVDFSNEIDISHLHIEGLAILTRDIQRDTTNKISILLRGDILATKASGSHNRVKEITCNISDIIPGEDPGVFVFMANTCTAVYKTQDSSDCPTKIPKQILTVKRATGLSLEDQKRLNTLRLKPQPGEHDKLFIEETDRRAREHQLKLINHLRNFLIDLNGKAG